MFRLSCCLKRRCSISSKCSKILGNSFNTYIRPSTMTVQQQNRNGSNLSMLNINPAVIAVEYAVRGPIVIKASEIEQELIEGVKKPFDRVIKANIGDCHAMGQKPITFIRQVIAACTYPPLIDQNIFPADVKERSKEILSSINGSTGCYSASSGLDIVRKHVASFIEKRDGYPCDAKNIIITNGASSSVKLLLELFPNDELKTGVMIPIPQYPLYSATVDEFCMQQVGYYLNEEKNWGLDITELKRSLDEAKKTCTPRLLCVINPGNPTGQVLSYDNIKEIIQFAKDEGLFLLADEVYQDNIYDEGCEFHSFKKVLHDMGSIDDFQMASFHSCSKGFMGECGLRGGYVEVLGLSDDVHYQLNKLQSAQLGSNVTGQIAMDCIVNPPKEGEPSYELFMKEKTAVLSSLKARAEVVFNALNKIEGVSCNPLSGAMYAFPQIHLPEKAINKAKSLKQEPDFFYCLALLEQTGICVVPGSGFRQKQDSYHFSVDNTVM
ncbi:alanine aminotransferase 2-like isoform X2 [Hydractinia symbiolongicarpus]|uniref:alanine aminotransferase 2-like isoform X2 n=1 Tax=Hydractinia symbiolongicarpus TaxID=13093 RepID=UPI00254F9B9C|nr:alanine aminotransferase 2-like isoform X2 [Hydractinia symbiolongicarpus]